MSWSHEEIIEAMHDWVAEHGRPPAMIDWNPALAAHRGDQDKVLAFYFGGRRWPPHHVVAQAFGSWNEAIRQAGLVDMPAGIKRATRAGQAGGAVLQWSREAVIEAIQAWAREFGRPPTIEQWSPLHAAREGHPERATAYIGDPRWPSTRTVVRYLGSWSGAIRAAGFTSAKRWTRLQAQAALTRWVAEHHRTPTAGQWKAAHARPTSKTIARLFGSWSTALAELNPDRIIELAKASSPTRRYELVRQAAANGMPTTLISAATGQGLSSISRTIHHVGPPPKDRRAPRQRGPSPRAMRSQRRDEQIASMWRDGLTAPQIAAALNSTPGSIGVAIVRLRKQGWNLPYRRPELARIAPQR